MGKDRPYIRRINTAPQNRADVGAGVTNAHIGMGGELLGGVTATNELLGTKDPSNQLGRRRIGLTPNGQTTSSTDPNRPGGGGGGDPLQEGMRLGGLDRLYAMNPTLKPGEMFNESDSRRSARKRENMRDQARKGRIGLIQKTHSEEAQLEKTIEDQKQQAAQIDIDRAANKAQTVQMENAAAQTKKKPKVAAPPSRFASAVMNNAANTEPTDKSGGFVGRLRDRIRRMREGGSIPSAG